MNEGHTHHLLKQALTQAIAKTATPDVSSRLPNLMEDGPKMSIGYFGLGGRFHEHNFQHS